MNYPELKNILKNHKLWLEDRPEGEHANLRNANLWAVSLRYANLRYADLEDADLEDADLRNADLQGANLENTLLSNPKFMSEVETEENNYYIFYKVFDTMYPPPSSWSIKDGSIIEENVNKDRTVECSYGINIGTLAWVKKWNQHYNVPVWKVRVHVTDLVVPYTSDGKVRASKIELIEIV